MTSAETYKIADISGVELSELQDPELIREARDDEQSVAFLVRVVGNRSDGVLCFEAVFSPKIWCVGVSRGGLSAWRCAPGANAEEKVRAAIEDMLAWWNG